jgi:hypothetical protein
LSLASKGIVLESIRIFQLTVLIHLLQILLVHEILGALDFLSPVVPR